MAPAARLPTSVDGRPASEVAEEAVRAAGAGILDKLPQMTGPLSLRNVIVTNKGSRNDPVTDVDHAAEAALLAILSAQYPDDAVLAEESGSRDGTRGFTWCVDPLDGTRNFASGIPRFAVNLSLSHGSDLVLALTYDPVHDELFHAVAGGGAWLNREPIRVSEETVLAGSILGCDLGYADDKAKLLLQMIERLWPGMQSIRMMGSAALGVAYTAAGRFGIYAHNSVQPWDIAPGILLVREAGGVATDLRGDPAVPESGCIVAASPPIHAAFMEATHGLPWRLSQG